MFEKPNRCKTDKDLYVEVEIGSMGVRVRDSKEVDGSGTEQILNFTFDEWRSFLKSVKEGQYDVPNTIEVGHLVVGVITANKLEATQITFRTDKDN